MIERLRHTRAAFIRPLTVCGVLGFILVTTGCNKRAPKGGLEDAAKRGDRAQVEEMLKRGADANEKDAKGRTSLLVATFYGRGGVVQTLLEHGADRTARTPQGFTALHIAAFKGQLQVAELLIKSGCDVNALDVKRKTPLDLASTDQMKTLLRNSGGKAGAELK